VSQEHRAALTSLLAAPRFEVYPARGVEEAVARLPRGATVAVTCSPARGIDATLQLSEWIARQGLAPVPHLAARLVGGRAQLQRVVQRLARLRLREVFVVGGDTPEPAGPYASALDLLHDLAAVGHDLDRIGVTAYPQGHPFLDDETLSRSLRDKQPLASYMVTQLCFDPAVIATWLADVRGRGVHLPVHLGLPGVVSTGRLLRFSLRIGVASSVRLLARHADLAGRLLGPGEYRPDGLVDGLAGWVGEPGYGVQALHLYTFNQTERTERWRYQMLRGGSHAHSL
jgi:methylenetetrahydrofolate reductase (NADPH)